MAEDFVMASLEQVALNPLATEAVEAKAAIDPTTVAYNNPVYIDAANTGIDMNIEHPVFGWNPFTAWKEGVEELERVLFARAEADGNVAPYVAPPPTPYEYLIGTLWGRMTDDEAEEFDSASMTASPLKMRKQFQLAISMTSDSELFAWVKALLASLFGGSRADELLAA
jgi:hypothetical protein